MPLAEEALKAGIKMMYQNVDVPKVRAKFGGGYVGAQLGPAGPRARRRGGPLLRAEVRRQGDRIGPFDESNRARTRAWRPPRRFEEAGVEGRPAQSRRPSGRPIRTLRSRRSPPRCQTTRTSRLIGYPGGQQLGNAPDLHAGGRQEARRHLQFRLRHQPADRRGLQGRLGAADLRPAAVPAGLHADPQPLPAGGLRPRRRSMSTPAPAS